MLCGGSISTFAFFYINLTIDVQTKENLLNDLITLFVLQKV